MLRGGYLMGDTRKKPAKMSAKAKKASIKAARNAKAAKNNDKREEETVHE